MSSYMFFVDYCECVMLMFTCSENEIVETSRIVALVPMRAVCISSV